MANIFAQMKEYVEKHKRNTFDLSFSNNLTFKFGQLVPVFCKEVIPGDSFKIRPSFGLRLMPMVFPVQTQINANLHFFYVRNRNLWKDWMDFIGRTKSGLVPPYIDNFEMFGTGKLADYLGCPTTIVGNYGLDQIATSSRDLVDNSPTVPDNKSALVYNYGSADSVILAPYLGIYGSGNSLRNLSSFTSNSATIYNAVVDSRFDTVQHGSCRAVISKEFDLGLLPDEPNTSLTNYYSGLTAIVNQANFASDHIRVYVSALRDGDWKPLYCLFNKDQDHPEYDFTVNDLKFTRTGEYQIGTLYFTKNVKDWRFAGLAIRSLYPSVNYSFDEVLGHLDAAGSRKVRFIFASEWNHAAGEGQDPDYDSRSFGSAEGVQLAVGSVSTGRIVRITALQDVDNGVSDVSILGQNSPYYNPSTSGLHISALPFRAYESIYNAFYRNQFNDPFILDGQKEYNKFIRSNEGGSDSFTYELLNRNYELDFLTSAKQSPVDGDITPLVGVSGTGKFTFRNQDGTTYSVTPVVGDDGNTITGIESVTGSPENTSGIRRLVDAISLGISINDFRNVNALQRWLETNLRRGYRYKDQIMSHFGVDASFEELDMPEFIGGMSNPVMINKIDQTADQTGNPDGLGDFAKVLGSYAGQAQCFASAKHTITKYCDEHGFIIGILSVTPVPCYSQLLPKFFIKDNVLDYFFPEFGHIGNQPITYKEVCPIQVYAADGSLTDAFGYQRAWYDYVASVDEIHGDFRTSLNGFLITRLFDIKPELGKSFIECSQDTMSNPFSVTDETDKILGQVFFDCIAQRPIPKFGIPRLE